MAIDKINLKNSIVSELNLLIDLDKQNGYKVHEAYVKGIFNYLKDNIEIKGIYSGTLSGGIPDSLNGEYIWKPFSYIVGVDNVFNSAKDSFNDWVLAINLGLKTFCITDYDISNKIQITQLSYSLLINISELTFDVVTGIWEGKTPEELRGLDYRDITIEKVSEYIVNGCKDKIPQPFNVTAVSIGGGSGTVILDKII